ncbi:MAG: sterol desaturase [Halobacteriovorax sp.]|nr:sterol desaturase [Halobacteriovorax sp.]
MPVNIYAVLTIPILLLVLAEFTYCLIKKNGMYTFQDSISSLGTAILNQCTNVIVATMFFPAYSWLNQNFAFTDPQANWLSFTLLFLGVDFLFYWFHRAGHSINILWAAHMPHHSTEELNYAVALRASFTQRAASFFFYWPLALFFPAQWVLPMVAFHLILQLIPHTRIVPKLPLWIESWLNTPSHHRVHHACNKQYRNKNFGGFIIIWDKLFGSWVEEKEEPYFGVTTPPRTWDPVAINIQWWKFLFDDMMATKSWFDKFRLWFMPIGWRPADLPPRTAYVRPEANAKTQEKFQSKEISGARASIILGLMSSFPLMLLVTHHESPLSYSQKMIVGILLWMSATSWAALLESRSWAKPFEFVRLIVSSLAITMIAIEHYNMTYAFVYLGIYATQALWAKFKFHGRHLNFVG